VLLSIIKIERFKEAISLGTNIFHAVIQTFNSQNWWING